MFCFIFLYFILTNPDQSSHNIFKRRYCDVEVKISVVQTVFVMQTEREERSK